MGDNKVTSRGAQRAWGVFMKYEPFFTSPRCQLRRLCVDSAVLPFRVLLSTLPPMIRAGASSSSLGSSSTRQQGSGSGSGIPPAWQPPEEDTSLRRQVLDLSGQHVTVVDLVVVMLACRRSNDVSRLILDGCELGVTALDELCEQLKHTAVRTVSLVRNNIDRNGTCRVAVVVLRRGCGCGLWLWFVVVVVVVVVDFGETACMAWHPYY